MKYLIRHLSKPIWVNVPDGWEVVKVGEVRGGDQGYSILAKKFEYLNDRESGRGVEEYWCVIRRKENA